MARMRRDKLKGGLADAMKPSDFKHLESSIRFGVDFELSRHTDDPDIAIELVMDNLVADPEHYLKLRAIQIMAKGNPEEDRERFVPAPIARSLGAEKRKQAEQVRRFLARAYHPDLTGGDSARLASINDAYDRKDWAALDRALQPFYKPGAVLPPGYGPPRDTWLGSAPGALPAGLSPAVRKQRDAEILQAAKAYATRYELLRRVATLALKTVFRVGASDWGKLDSDTRGELVQEIVGEWISGPGAPFILVVPPDRPGVRPSSFIRDLGFTAEDIRVRPLPQSVGVIYDQMRGLANEARAARRGAAEREAYASQDKPSGWETPDAAPTPEEAASSRQQRETGEWRFSQALHTFSQGPGGSIRALIIHSHLPMQRGVAFALISPPPEDAIALYHTVGRSKPCPYCRAISRRLRVPGISESSVRDLIDAFLVEVRAQT